MLTINKQLRTSLGLAFGSRVRVALRADQSRYGLPLPKELQAAFRLDGTWKRLFHALTPGRQRTLLYIVNRGTSVEERSFRAVTILKHLEENQGVLNYRRLASLLKKNTGGSR